MGAHRESARLLFERHLLFACSPADRSIGTQRADWQFRFAFQPRSCPSAAPARAWTAEAFTTEMRQNQPVSAASSTALPPGGSHSLKWVH